MFIKENDNDREESHDNNLNTQAYHDNNNLDRVATSTSSLDMYPEVIGASEKKHFSLAAAAKQQQQQQQHHHANCDFVTIIHFNDCYNVEPGPRSSGAAGFLTAVNQFRHLQPMILFSGDIISPSFMSTFTKGEQMIPVLNDIGVDCAVFGNHEFDYGVDNLVEFTKQTTFPWLLSNVIDKETSNQLGDGLVFHILERAGLKFGLIGLIEEEWLSTLSTLDSSDMIYEDFVVRGRELARRLKGAPHYVDYVIALTHFRTPNDIRLADAVPEIDLILGGHDHDYEIIKRPNSYIIKSGTDFREFSLIKLQLNGRYLEEKQQQRRQLQTSEMMATNGLSATREGEFNTQYNENNNENKKRLPFADINIERIDCASYPQEANLKLKLDKFVSTIDEKMGKVLGQFNCELDGRFSSIRKYETNLGNFVTDIMLASTHADLAILNSGTLRSDRIHPKGDFTMRDLFNILGYIDPIAVLQASGQHIWRALENGVSQWPKLEGRFPQISGCSFVFDPSKPPHSRIDPTNILIGEEPLDMSKQYKLTTKAYLASGKDGYDVLKECEILVPGDESPDLTTSILNHFEAISIIKSNRRTHHRQSIICLSRSSIKKLLDQTANNSEILAAHNLQPTEKDETDTNNNNDNYSDNDNDNDNNNNNNSLANGNNYYDNIDDAATTATDDCANQKDGDAISSLCTNSSSQQQKQLIDHVVKVPVASSPLVGSSAPTPTLSNMRSDSCCDGVAATAVGEVIRAAPLTPIIKRQTTTTTARRQPRTKRVMSLYEMENEQCKLEPKVEGRIKILGVNY